MSQLKKSQIGNRKKDVCELWLEVGTHIRFKQYNDGIFLQLVKDEDGQFVDAACAMQEIRMQKGTVLEYVWDPFWKFFVVFPSQDYADSKCAFSTIRFSNVIN